MSCARPVRPAWSEPSPQAPNSTSSLSHERRPEAASASLVFPRDLEDSAAPAAIDALVGRLVARLDEHVPRLLRIGMNVRGPCRGAGGCHQGDDCGCLLYTSD